MDLCDCYFQNITSHDHSTSRTEVSDNKLQWTTAFHAFGPNLESVPSQVIVRWTRGLEQPPSRHSSNTRHFQFQTICQDSLF